MTYLLYDLEHPKEIIFDCGKTLPKIEVAYHTYGKPNHDMDNVIVICHPLTGDSDAKWCRK